ncbi:unnamed protein product [Leuciscus chuanchicus]
MSQSMDDARELLKCITIVALSETEGSDSSGAPLISERCKKYLKARIAEECVIIPDVEGEDLEEVDPCDQTQTDLRQWVTDICEESRSLATSNGDHDNMHFLPEIIPNIIWLANYLPLWTGVMIPHFRSSKITASSANVEAEFKNIKRGLFKHEHLPIRVDRFIARHLSFIEGNMRIFSAKQKSVEKGEEDEAVATVSDTGVNPLPTTTCRIDGRPEMDASCSGKSDTVTDIHPTDEEAVENWRGLAVPPKKRKRSSYLSPCPEWLHADPSASGMAHLQTAVEEGLDLPESPCLRPIQSLSQCPSAIKPDTSEKVLCAGKVSHSYSLGELMWIDTDLGSNSTEFPLSEFPSNLMLQGKIFTLRAVIAFRGGLTQDALGHYVAYCRRSPCVWEMYDDLRSGVTGASDKNKICPHAVLYTKD